MNQTASLAAAAGLLILVLITGCTSPTGTGFPAPVTQATPSPLPSTVPVTSVTATPVAVATLPEEQFVDVSVTKERPDASIHLLYNGGKGEMFVQNILLVVTRSDGRVIQEYLNDNSRKPRRGDELVVQGTRGTDQVQVYIRSSNTVYKIIDESLVTSHL